MPLYLHELINLMYNNSKQINNDVWLKTPHDMLRSLLADEAKNAAILDEIGQTLKQLRAKSSFRLALINTLLEDIADVHNKSFKGNNK